MATNAGGMCCVKYGVTAEYVLGLEVVLADGEVLRTGRRTAKGVAGYDLTRLFVGSEGTLGVITEITVALRPAAEESLTLVAVFPSTAAAGAAVAAHRRRRAVAEPAGAARPDAPAGDRGVPADGAARPTPRRCCWPPPTPAPARAADLERIAAACTAAGADEVYAATDADRGRRAAAGPAAGPPGDGGVRRRPRTRAATAA